RPNRKSWNLETWPNGSPQFGENLSKYDPNWPIGGAIATKSAKLLITPRPYVVDSSVLYLWKAGLLKVKTYISDFISGMQIIRHFELCQKPTFAN
ncbi:hypothetical protein PO909_026770, partial [Leuciscus waleckii]